VKPTNKPPMVIQTTQSAPTTSFQPDTIPAKKPTTMKPITTQKPVITQKPATTWRPTSTQKSPTTTQSVLPPAIVPMPVTPGPGTDVAKCDGNSPCGPYKVVCYFTNWSWYRQGNGKYLPSDIDASLCTHIVYGFAVLDSGTLQIKPHDSWADFDNSRNH
jgi:chitinase